MLENLNQALFRDALNTEFAIRLKPETAVPARLVELTDLGSNAEVEQFSLVFLCPGPAILQQQIYTIEHPRLGSFGIFLVPIRRDNAGVYYEAVFNRRIEKAD